MVEEANKRRELPPRLSSVVQFRAWEQQMRLHFQRSGSWEMVLGTATPPSNVDKRKKHDQKVAGAHCDLLCCLQGTLKDLALAHTSLPNAWKAVKEACGVADEVELQRLEEEIEELTFQKSVLVTVTTLKSLYTRLEAVGGSLSETQKTLKLLKILPRSYQELVLNIKTSDAYRNQNKTYNFTKVVNAVQQRGMVTWEASLEMSTNAEPRVKQEKKVLKAQLICFNCKKPGHTKWKCPCCFNCKKKGHRSTNCPKKSLSRIFKKFCVMKAKRQNMQLKMT